MAVDRTTRQKLGVKRWIQSGCKGTLAYATGVGKSFTAIMAIQAFLTKNQDKTIVVVVPTEYLKIQWITELNKHQLLNYVSVEIINSAIKTNTLIDFLIFDEVHRAAAQSFIQLFTNRAPQIVLGLSATFKRLDGREELLKQYCPICDVISIKEAVTNQWLSPYKEYKVLIDPDDISRYQELNKDFNAAFSIFDFDFNEAMACLTNIIHRRWYAKKMGIPAKDMDAIVFTWQRSLKDRNNYVNNHPKKLEITRKILNARKNKKAITFSSTIAQAEAIKIGFVVHSGKTKKKNRITMDEFRYMKSGVLCTSKMLDEGADIPGLSVAVILSNSSSSTQKAQRLGRCIRFKEGKEAEIFTLVVKGTMEEARFEHATNGNNYIEITESELDEILSGNESENLEQEAHEVDQLFRF